MLGILNDKEIETVLNNQVFGHLGCSDNSKTYIVPISYAYDGKYLYFHSHEGLKISIMRRNPNVCFQVEIMQNMGNWQSVLGSGEFEELNDPTLRNEALQKLMDRILPIVSSEKSHLSPHWPFPPDDINSIKGIVFRILLTEKSGRYESNLTTDSFAH